MDLARWTFISSTLILEVTEFIYCWHGMPNGPCWWVNDVCIGQQDAMSVTRLSQSIFPVAWNCICHRWLRRYMIEALGRVVRWGLFSMGTFVRRNLSVNFIDFRAFTLCNWTGIFEFLSKYKFSNEPLEES